jgi:hypothetical protein
MGKVSTNNTSLSQFQHVRKVRGFRYGHINDERHPECQFTCQSLVRAQSEESANSNLRIRIPLLERFELYGKRGVSKIASENTLTFETHIFPELVHGANTPLASLLYSQNFDYPEHLGRSTSTVSASRVLSRIMQNIGNIIVRELAIWATY